MTSPQIAKFVSQIFYPTVTSFILLNLKLDKRKCPTLSGMVMNIQRLICIVKRFEFQIIMVCRHFYNNFWENLSTSFYKVSQGKTETSGELNFHLNRLPIGKIPKSDMFSFNLPNGEVLYVANRSEIQNRSIYPP